MSDAIKPPRLPGDHAQENEIARMIRVDHAGEHGAVQIYAGQLAVLGHTKAGDTIRHMAAQEAEHLETFDRLVTEHGVRPTALSPIWHVAGYALVLDNLAELAGEWRMALAGPTGCAANATLADVQATALTQPLPHSNTLRCKPVSTFHTFTFPEGSFVASHFFTDG
jgi:hypothetical protein